MVRVDPSSRRISSFLSKGHPKLLRLAVAGRDGAPHVSSMWYLWKGGNFYVTTSEDRLKARAIKQNPKVALIVDTDVQPYEGIIVEGKAQLTKVDLRKITLAIVKRYVPAEHVRAEFEDLMRYPRVLIKIKPLKCMDIMSYKTR